MKTIPCCHLIFYFYSVRSTGKNQIFFSLCRMIMPLMLFLHMAEDWPVAPTPNLDRLAKEGALFKKCFVRIQFTPRACVLTGQYNHTNGAVDLSGSYAGKQMLAIEMKKVLRNCNDWQVVSQSRAQDFDYYCVLQAKENITDLLSNTGRKTLG